MRKSLRWVFAAAIGIFPACGEAERESTASAAIPVRSKATGPELRFDVREIAGRRADEIAAVLGDPSTVTTSRHDGEDLPDLWYRGDSMTIRYVNGRAEWFDVSQLDALPFSPRALEAFGIFNPPPPSFANSHVIRWENGALPGFLNVYIFPGRGHSGVDYVYFNHTTEP